MARQKTHIEVTCEHCHKPFRLHPSRLQKAKRLFCSRACYALARGNNPAMHPCATCGTLILRRIWHLNDPKPFFCSRQCISTYYKRPVAERFWEKVDMSGGPKACWPWTAFCNDDGYGKFAKEARKVISAHVMAYELTYGPLAEGMQGLHRCDNPPCCNPSHIFPGTQADNIQDCIAKGRHSFGAMSPHVKLTDADVVEILRLKGKMLQPAVALHFNVSKPTISQIWNNHTWLHIPRN